jgi:spoIIIJ-associated protein
LRTIETTGKSPEEAIELALKELDAERGQVEIDVVSEGKAGLLGIVGGEPARVRVTVLEQATDAVKVTSDIIERLVDLMDVDVVVNLRSAEREDVGGPVFDITGDDSGLLIGRRGETLKSLQFMVGFLASRKMEQRVNLFLDVSGYQERRYKSLNNLARRVADRVASSGRPVTLEPMPPDERRIVHLALAENPEVTTTSTGEGDGRQITVTPADDYL